MTQGIELTIEQLGMLTDEVRRPEGPGDAAHTKAFNSEMVEAMRVGRGRADGELGGLQLLILISTGRKSGLPRENPVSYFMFEGRAFMLASMGGADINPQWFHNVAANPNVEIEWFGERFAAQAIPLEGGERDRVFAEICRQAPIFSEYQSRTERALPVVEVVAPDVDFDAILARDPWIDGKPGDGNGGADRVYSR